MAHDFNNLLTAISGHTDLLMLDVPPDTPEEDGLSRIRQATDKAAALTNQLLGFSRQQVFQPRPLHLAEVVDGLTDLLRRLLGERIRLETSTEEAAWEVRADPNQLEQVVMNLCVNSRDAMPEGGSLRIGLERLVLSEEEPRPPGVPAGRYSVLEVRDEGEGIPEDVLPHIFEPFFTTKEIGKGTGLGLAMVYGIMKQHGGFVSVHSEEGEGTAIRLYLPPAHDTEVRSAGGSHRPRPAAETILLVEADDIQRESARRLLEEQGYIVLTAEGPRRAMDLFEAVEGSVDLLLTNVVMPGMSGPGLARELSERRPGLRVLFTSEHTDGSVLEALDPDRPAPDFIPKPFPPSALAREVRRVLGAPNSPW